MVIEHKGDFIKIQSSLIRIAKIDSVKMRTVIKANNFGKVSDEAVVELIISIGADKHVFAFENEQEQIGAFGEIEKIIAS